MQKNWKRKHIDSGAFMIKVLYVLNNPFNRGGTEAVVLNYYSHMDHNEIEIEFAVHATKKEYDESILTQELLNDGVVIHRITPRKESIEKNKEDLRNLFTEMKYDIIHTHTDAIGSYILKIAKECNVNRRIAHSHNTSYTFKPDSLKTVLKYLYLEKCRLDIRKVATGYMACSNVAAQWLFGKKKAKETYILNNAIDTNKYVYSEDSRRELRKQYGFKEDDLIIGNVGRLEHQKNQAFLLDVLAEVKKVKKNVKLLIIGEGSLRKNLEDKAKEMSLSEDVILPGSVNNVEKVLNVFDVFAFPSLFEGFAVSIIEAQANGLKCIANDTPRVTKDTDFTKNTSWVEAVDPIKWKDEILAMDFSRDKKAQEKIKAAGFDIVSEAKKLEEYYKGLIDNDQ